MKLPGPDHPITIAPHAGVVRITADGVLIAETSRALALKEASYPEVLYVPRDDVSLSALTRTSHVTHCPYKGDASYYSVTGDGQTIANAVWSYETPFPAMQQIAGYMAFYPSKVSIERVGKAS